MKLVTVYNSLGKPVWSVVMDDTDAENACDDANDNGIRCGMKDIEPDDDEDDVFHRPARARRTREEKMQGLADSGIDTERDYDDWIGDL